MPTHDDPDMTRALARKGAPDVGEHVATLNLFREADGTFWLTCASARGAVEEAKRLNNGTTPMQVLSVWIREAGGRFIESWGKTKTAAQQAKSERARKP